MYENTLFAASLLMQNNMKLDCYIDVGVGDPRYLTFAGHLFKKTIGFEPGDTYQKINDYIKKQFDLNITVYNMAVSDRNYTGNFYQNLRNSAYSTSDYQRVIELETNKKLFFHEDWKTKKIRYKRIDDMNLIPPNKTLSYLKSDIETDEMIVIRGAAETIKKFRPIVQLEHVYENYNMTECKDFFESIDYRFVQPWIKTDNFFIIPSEMKYNEPLCN